MLTLKHDDLRCVISRISSANPTKLEKAFSNTRAKNAAIYRGGALCAIAHPKKVVCFPANQDRESIPANFLSCGTSTIGENQVIICCGSAQRFFYE